MYRNTSAIFLNQFFKKIWYLFIILLKVWKNGTIKVILIIHIHIAKICNNSEVYLKLVYEIYLPENLFLSLKTKLIIWFFKFRLRQVLKSKVIFFSILQSYIRIKKFTYNNVKYKWRESTKETKRNSPRNISETFHFFNFLYTTYIFMELLVI